jgi:protein tyrosine/serine phosphatase
MRFSSPIFALFLSGALSLAPAPVLLRTDDSPRPSSPQKISVPGVRNAGKVSEHLFRGAQPSLSELHQLKNLGITTIIDLRAESSGTAEAEQKRAESLGIKFLRIPIGGFSNPTDSELAHFFQVLRDSPAQIIFVHCEFGKDRTGVMIAAYRIAFENWSSEQALSEMMDFGFNRLWHPSMITFVRNLPNRLQSSSELQKALKPN